MFEKLAAKLQGRLPKRETYLLMSRDYSEVDTHLVNAFLRDVLTLRCIDQISYEAPYEDPEATWPKWFEGRSSYNGIFEQQNLEQLEWISMNAARLMCVDIYSFGDSYLNVGLCDTNTLYVETRAGEESVVQELPGYRLLAERSQWDVSQQRGFHFWR